VAARFSFNQGGTLDAVNFVQDDIGTNISWRLSYIDAGGNFVQPNCSTPRAECLAKFAQQTRLVVNYSGTLELHVKSFRKINPPNPGERIFSFTTGSGIDLSMENRPAADLLGRCPVDYLGSPIRIAHFAWFYLLSANTTADDKFPFPETTDFNAPQDDCASFGGKPYCSNAFFMP
jgi:hypothetical protein